MEANPNAHQLERLLSMVIIPQLEVALSGGIDFTEPHQQLMLNNVNQYALHLRRIVSAINEDNEQKFDQAVQELRGEAWIGG